MEIEDENRRELPAERAEQTTDRQPTSQPDRQTDTRQRPGQERLGNCVGKWVETLLLDWAGRTGRDGDGHRPFKMGIYVNK